MRDPGLRFVEYEYQLLILAEHAKLLEQAHPRFLDVGKQLVRSRLDAGDEAERPVGSDLEAALENGVLTRFLAASSIVGAWAVFEQAVTDVAEYAYWRVEAPLTFGDVRGDLANRAARYFTEVLGLACFSDPAEVAQLRALELLRHTVGHGNGQLSRMSARRTELEQWARSQPDLAIVDGEYIVVGFDFVRRSLDFLREIVSRMVDEVLALDDPG